MQRLCLVGFLWFSIIFIGAAETVTFTFAPESHPSFKEYLTRTRTKTYEQLGAQKEVLNAITEISSSKTVSGWEIQHTPIKGELIQDGQIMDNPITRALNDTSITFILDETATLVDIEGYDALYDKVINSIPPQLANAVSSMLNPKDLKEKEISEWNGRIGDFIGETIEIGDTWEWTGPITLPNGSTIEYTVETTFTGWEELSGSTCLKIESLYDGSSDDLSESINQNISNVTQSLNINDDPNSLKIQGDAKIAGSIVRYIDPNTMLIYKEESTRIITMEMDIPNVGPIPMTLDEEKTYTYSYNQ